MRILKLNLKGSDVKDWQDFLRQQGLDPGPSDGQFGAKTEDATKAFQASQGLTSDGIVGNASITAATAAGFAPSSQPAGSFDKTLAKVFNRGTPDPDFLQQLVDWGKSAPEEIFADQPGNTKDIYASIVDELGPFNDGAYRRACMLEVMRVLAGLESSWNWNEGVDTHNPNENSATTISAGAFQVSANSMGLGNDLKPLVASHNNGTVPGGNEFQDLMKADHPLAMEYIARLIRHTRMHNGPLYKGSERAKFKPPLDQQNQSVYPWLSRAAAAEFQSLLA